MTFLSRSNKHGPYFHFATEYFKCRPLTLFRIMFTNPDNFWISVVGWLHGNGLFGFPVRKKNLYTQKCYTDLLCFRQHNLCHGFDAVICIHFVMSCERKIFGPFIYWKEKDVIWLQKILLFDWMKNKSADVIARWMCKLCNDWLVSRHIMIQFLYIYYECLSIFFSL